MDGEFRRRHGEDQPSATRVDVLEAQYTAEESAISISIRAEDDDVGTENHAPILPGLRQLHPVRREHAAEQIRVDGLSLERSWPSI
jgi:hypothetical protein